MKFDHRYVCGVENGIVGANDAKTPIVITQDPIVLGTLRTRKTILTEPDDPLEGTDYRVIHLLGSGGMGEVYEAEHVPTGEIVAVKVLLRRFAQRADIVDRLKMEAEILGLLQHPNLVSVREVARAPYGRPFMVMERLFGGTLFDELQERGALPPVEAIAIARQILAGLGAAHAHSVVHRDIKASNIFLSGSGPNRTVKVLDFGLAKLLDPEQDLIRPLAVPTAEGAFVGTAQYTSPEQARGIALDHRADIYAVGVVLYGMIAGRLPFSHRKSRAAVLEAHRWEVPPPPSHDAPYPVPPELDAAVMRALSKFADERQASAAEFATELARVPLPVSTAAGEVRLFRERRRVPVEGSLVSADSSAADSESWTSGSDASSVVGVGGSSRMTYSHPSVECSELRVFRPGDRCGSYEIVRMIAEGGIGQVYEGVHEWSKRRVAIKALQLTHAQDEESRRRMEHEARFLESLRSPNIVTTYESNVTPEGIMWICMELLEGQTLREFLDSGGRLSIPDTLFVLREVVKGLGVAHECGAIHRDVKPENIFLANDVMRGSVQVKLLDFGMAKLRQLGAKLTSPGRPLGTPEYMSPEQVNGDEVDERTDVYSLGLVAVELFTGRHVFMLDGRRREPRTMAMCQLATRPTPLLQLAPHLPGSLADLVDRSLAKDPALRPANMPMLARAFRRERLRFLAQFPRTEIRFLLDGEEAPSRPADARAISVSGHPADRSVGPAISRDDPVETPPVDALRVRVLGTADALTRKLGGIVLRGFLLAVAVAALHTIWSRLWPILEARLFAPDPSVARQTAHAVPDPRAQAAPAPQPAPEAIALPVPAAPEARTVASPSVSSPAPRAEASASARPPAAANGPQKRPAASKPPPREEEDPYAIDWSGIRRSFRTTDIPATPSKRLDP